MEGDLNEEIFAMTSLGRAHTQPEKRPIILVNGRVYRPSSIETWRQIDLTDVPLLKMPQSISPTLLAIRIGEEILSMGIIKEITVSRRRSGRLVKEFITTI